MLRQSIEIVARLPVIAAQSYAVYRNAFCNKSLNLHNPHDDLSTAENFLRVLRSDKKYTEAEAHLLDLCLVIHAEHGGGNCSTFTTRVLSSSERFCSKPIPISQLLLCWKNTGWRYGSEFLL